MKLLHPRATWIFFFNSLSLIAVLPFLIGGFFSYISMIDTDRVVTQPDFYDGSLYSYFWIFILVTIVLLYIWAQLSYKNYRYEITDLGVRIEKGVIWKHSYFIPYNKVQNVDVRRGILSRILGLADIMVQTAGYSGVAYSEGLLPGLSKDQAKSIQEDLISRANKD